MISAWNIADVNIHADIRGSGCGAPIHLYFSVRSASDSLSPGTHLHVTPTSMSSPSAVWILVLSDILNTAWWSMLKRTDDVGHSSLKHQSGWPSSLSPSFPLTWYAVVSLRSCTALMNFPSRLYLCNIPLRAVLLTWGIHFGGLRDVLPGPSSYPLGILIALLLFPYFNIHHILLHSYPVFVLLQLLPWCISFLLGPFPRWIYC